MTLSHRTTNVALRLSDSLTKSEYRGLSDICSFASFIPEVYKAIKFCQKMGIVLDVDPESDRPFIYDDQTRTVFFSSDIITKCTYASVCVFVCAVRSVEQISRNINFFKLLDAEECITYGRFLAADRQAFLGYSLYELKQKTPEYKNYWRQFLSETNNDAQEEDMKAKKTCLYASFFSSWFVQKDYIDAQDLRILDEMDVYKQEGGVFGIQKFSSNYQKMICQTMDKENYFPYIKAMTITPLSNIAQHYLNQLKEETDSVTAQGLVFSNSKLAEKFGT